VRQDAIGIPFPEEVVRVHKLVVCPYCQSDQIIKRGKTDAEKQRDRRQNEECSHLSFLLDPAYKGRLPKITQHVIEMSLNGSGIRDTARVLQMSTATVMQELTKRDLSSHRALRHS
jgi:transposase-like protein